jgi:hypothetical protein
MLITGLDGPFALNDEDIDGNVEEGIGVYALGKETDGRFRILFIGRADYDLNDRLHQHVGEYDLFKFRRFPTLRDAFDKECKLYHDFAPPDNQVHPERPLGTDYRCPSSGCSH